MHRQYIQCAIPLMSDSRKYGTLRFVVLLCIPVDMAGNKKKAF